MTRQYKREYKLTIIPPDELARVVRDLRINFEITKSAISTPNLIRLTVYNPNEDTIAALQKKYTRIMLEVGYEGNTRLVYDGQLRNVIQNRSGVDSQITVYAGDGQRDWENAVFNKTYGPNVSIKTVITEILGGFKEVTIGTLEGVPDTATKLRGQSFSGASKDVMDTLAADYGFTWSIQDGEAVTVEAQQPISSADPVLITAGTGMIGSPAITEIGVDVTTLLNPLLLPNRPFRIESVGQEFTLGELYFRNIRRTVAEGTYTVQETIFRGDSWEGAWTSTVKGIVS